jgi:hypothetical protein
MKNNLTLERLADRGEGCMDIDISRQCEKDARFMRCLDSHRATFERDGFFICLIGENQALKL